MSNPILIAVRAPLDHAASNLRWLYFLMERDQLNNHAKEVLKAHLSSAIQEIEHAQRDIEGLHKEVERLEGLLEKAQPRLEWTKELPTAPGYYWDRLGNGPVSISRVFSCYKRIDDPEPSLWLDGEGPLEHYQGREWAGPIPEPNQA